MLMHRPRSASLTVFEKSSAARRIVEDGRDRVGSSMPSITARKSRRHVAIPVRGRYACRDRPQRAAVDGIANIHGLERQRHFQKLLQLGHAALSFLPRLGIAKTM